MVEANEYFEENVYFNHSIEGKKKVSERGYIITDVNRIDSQTQSSVNPSHARLEITVREQEAAFVSWAAKCRLIGTLYQRSPTVYNNRGGANFVPTKLSSGVDTLPGFIVDSGRNLKERERERASQKSWMLWCLYVEMKFS